MSAISSLLRTGLKELPEDTVVPAQSVPNLLKKKGIKEEEIKFSGVELPKEGKVTKADLLKMEEGRKDIFSTEFANAYNWVSLKPGRNNPTYKEKVTTYSDKGAQPPVPSTEFVEDVPGEIAALEGSRYTSSHFSEVPNYLMHSRVYDDTLDGTPTRVVQEIQSDLHQAGRQHGYAGAELSATQQAEVRKDFAEIERLYDEGDYDAGEVIVARVEQLLPHLKGTNWLDSTVDSVLASATSTPKSPFEKTWLRKGMEREITDAIDEGRSQVAIPISGAVDDLKRAPGVQKWYETTVLSTAKKLAKSSGMDFELKTVGQPGQFTAEQLEILKAYKTEYTDELADKAFDIVKSVEFEGADEVGRSFPETVDFILSGANKGEGKVVTYAVLKAKEGAKPSFALYASPGATAYVAYQALSEGMPQDDVERMLSEDGYNELEIQDILANTQTIATMKSEGYTDEDIKPMLEHQEVDVANSESKPMGEPDPQTPGRISDAYRDIVGAEDMTIKELVSKMETVYPDDSFVTTNIAGFFGDQEAQRISDASRVAQRNRITTEAKNKFGLDLEFGPDGEWYAQTEDGPVMVTPEWWRGFTENKMELVGGIAGGYAGIKAGLVTAAATPGGPLVKLGAGFTVAAAITSMGSVLGTELDYMHSALTLQQDFEAQAMARKAMTAAELSVIGDAIGGGVIKVAGSSWRGMKGAVDYVRQGMFDRAGLALKETFFINDDEAAELVTKLSRVAKVEGKTPTEKAIAATAVTKPGAEELVQASVHTDPRASRAVVKAVDDRAKDLLATTGKLEGEDVGRFLREDFEGYRSLVREGFERTKAQAGAAPKANAFRFDYDKMALDPVLERLGKNIENPDLAFKFGRQAQKIRDMSKSRRLGDLIELRKLVNEFRYNKRISNAKDYEMLDGIKAGIDRSIELGAEVTMENPKEWLGAWRTANKQYSEMKALEKNVLAKVLTRPGVSEKAIGQALTKYATSLDSTFVEVLAQLPKKSRARAEGSVLNTLAQKYTAGAVDGVKATNFPALAEDLKAVNFTSPEARSTKKAINELAEVFKNDVPLSQSAGGIQVTQFAQALTTDPVAKAKFALASHMFHYVRSMAPGRQGRASALITKTTKLLEEPMSSKTIKELRELVDGEVNLEPQVEELIKQATMQQASGGGMPRMRLYGDGAVLTGKGKGAEHSIPIHRIADTETVKAISEATGINLADKKALNMALQERGYMAAQLGADKVRLLK